MNSVAMNAMGKYLDAIEAAVEAKDAKAIEMLHEFSAYVFQEVDAKTNGATGDERTSWDTLRTRVQDLIARMAQSSPDIWM
jgi:hypothetical protein